MCKWSLVRPFWRKGKVMNTGIWIIFCTSYDSCFYVLAFNEMSCWKVWNKVLLHLYNFDNTIYLASLFLGNINTFLEIFLLENNNNNKQIITVDCLMWYHTICTTSGKVQKVEKCICSFSASPTILRELCDRHLEYTTWSNIRICVGTWNVNGGKHFRSIAHKHQTMHDWLLDFHKTLPDSGYSETDSVDFRLPTDIFAIGFEELVDLNASNIVSTR